MAAPHVAGRRRAAARAAPGLDAGAGEGALTATARPSTRRPVGPTPGRRRARRRRCGRRAARARHARPRSRSASSARAATSPAASALDGRRAAAPAHGRCPSSRCTAPAGTTLTTRTRGRRPGRARAAARDRHGRRATSSGTLVSPARGPVSAGSRSGPASAVPRLAGRQARAPSRDPGIYCGDTRGTPARVVVLPLSGGAARAARSAHASPVRSRCSPCGSRDPSRTSASSITLARAAARASSRASSRRATRTGSPATRRCRSTTTRTSTSSATRRPSPARCVRAPGVYHVVFDSATRAERAGTFRFRFWVDDGTPTDARALASRTVRAGGPVTARVADTGSGIDPTLAGGDVRRPRGHRPASGRERPDRHRRPRTRARTASGSSSRTSRRRGTTRT